MMMIGQWDMHNDSAAALPRMRGGETLIVTNGGRPVSRLVPIRAGALGDIEAESMGHSLQEEWDTFSAPRHAPRLSAVDIIADAHGHGR